MANLSTLSTHKHNTLKLVPSMGRSKIVQPQAAHTGCCSKETSDMLLQFMHLAVSSPWCESTHSAEPLVEWWRHMASNQQAVLYSPQETCESEYKSGTACLQYNFSKILRLDTLTQTAEVMLSGSFYTPQRMGNAAHPSTVYDYVPENHWLPHVR